MLFAILAVARLFVVLPELDLESGRRRLGSLKLVVTSRSILEQSDRYASRDPVGITAYTTAWEHLRIRPACKPVASKAYTSGALKQLYRSRVAGTERRHGRRRLVSIARGERRMAGATAVCLGRLYDERPQARSHATGAISCL